MSHFPGQKSITPESYWRSRSGWIRKLRYDEKRLPFRDLFDRYLPRGGTCLEVGFYPGQFLIYLSKRFGYTVSGIDVEPFEEPLLRLWMSDNGAKVGELIQGDFLDQKLAPQYDVVCSFGFVEHFQDTEDILVRHEELVKPGGTLVVTCPNFTRGQYVLHSLFDSDNLRVHNVGAMDLGKWAQCLERLGMEIVYQNYYGTIGFLADWSHASLPRLAAVAAISEVTRVLNWVVSYPSSMLSPYMISISRKTG